jgi:hypothetical protein
LRTFSVCGLANEVFPDVYERLASFEPKVTGFTTLLFDAYAAGVARVDTIGDGVISAAEGDVDTASDGFADNGRLFIPATQFNRFAVTREINDGLLAPRLAPSQKAWVLSGALVPVNPSVLASQGRGRDDLPSERRHRQCRAEAGDFSLRWQPCAWQLESTWLPTQVLDQRMAEKCPLRPELSKFNE